jgi:hypothetical protein
MFHYGVTEGARERFKRLVERCGLIETFDPEHYDLQGARRIWYRARQIRSSHRSDQCGANCKSVGVLRHFFARYLGYDKYASQPVS